MLSVNLSFSLFPSLSDCPSTCPFLFISFKDVSWWILGVCTWGEHCWKASPFPTPCKTQGKLQGWWGRKQDWAVPVLLEKYVDAFVCVHDLIGWTMEILSGTVWDGKEEHDSSSLIICFSSTEVGEGWQAHKHILQNNHTFQCLGTTAWLDQILQLDPFATQWNPGLRN